MSNEKILFEDKKYKVTEIAHCKLQITDKETEFTHIRNLVNFGSDFIPYIVSKLGITQAQNAELTEENKKINEAYKERINTHNIALKEYAQEIQNNNKLTQKLEGAREALIGILDYPTAKSYLVDGDEMKDIAKQALEQLGEG